MLLLLQLQLLVPLALSKANTGHDAGGGDSHLSESLANMHRFSKVELGVHIPCVWPAVCLRWMRKKKSDGGSEAWLKMVTYQVGLVANARGAAGAPGSLSGVESALSSASCFLGLGSQLIGETPCYSLDFYFPLLAR